jgi:hypothetical protein
MSDPALYLLAPIPAAIIVPTDTNAVTGTV